MSYQNIPGWSAKFERDCAERWALIRPHLPLEGVVVDIGAAEGYFLNAVAEQTGLLAVGVEKHRGRVAFQHRWLATRHAGAVVSCHAAIGETMIARIAATPEWFDAVLLLSTLHWIKSDLFLQQLASMSGRLFVEIPDLNDRQATGQRFMDHVRTFGSQKAYFEQVTGRTVRHLGTVGAVWAATRDVWLIDGDLQRTTHQAHINNGPTKNTYEQDYTDGRLIYRNKKRPAECRRWIPGVNLATLAALNITYPSQSWWVRRITAAVEALPLDARNDLRRHNVIVSRDGVHWIDTQHHGHAATIFDELEGMVRDV